MTESERHRFIVLVWMYDHWGVTYTTNDETEASRVLAAASLKVPAAAVFDFDDPFNSTTFDKTGGTCA